MLCPNCGKRMEKVFHFDSKRNYQFYKCKCLHRTNNKRICYNDKVFEKTNQTNLN